MVKALKAINFIYRHQANHVNRAHNSLFTTKTRITGTERTSYRAA